MQNHLKSAYRTSAASMLPPCPGWMGDFMSLDHLLKRKREEEPSVSPTPMAGQGAYTLEKMDESGLNQPSFSPDILGDAPILPDPSSPGSSMAHDFNGLGLEDKDRMSTDDMDVEVEDPKPKRQKTADLMQHLMRLPLRLQHQQKKPAESTTADLGSLPDIGDAARQVSSRSPGKGGLQRAYPSINRLSESKSRGQKKVDTSTWRVIKNRKKDSQPQDQSLPDAMDDSDVVEPIRASLTWKQDEITVYDPDDKDDDGLGVNGVGFKPTPAMAQARSVKRRQQLANYRKREEMEARAERSQRRRGDSSLARQEKNPSPRRVRFLDADDMDISLLIG